MSFSDNFRKAYAKLIGHEGSYSDHKKDRGGETYKGIARKFNPKWPGWSMVDFHKESSKDPIASMAEDALLQNAVMTFYQDHHWDVFAADEIPYPIAYELFEIGVNCGVATATQLLQRALNAFNKEEVLWSNLHDDGVFGPKTLMALKAMMAQKDRDSVKVLCVALNCLQGARYIEIARKNESQEAFMWGWFNRVEIVK